MFSFPDPLPDLADATVALRPAAERDIPEVLIAHQDDPGLARALHLRRPPSGAELGRRAEESAARRAGGEELWLTILDRAGEPDECCGQLDVSAVDDEDRTASVTIWIAPHARGRGLGRSALEVVSRWLLTAAGLERVQILADRPDAARPDAGYRDTAHLDTARPNDPNEPGPPASALIAAAGHAGFSSEGVLRAYTLTDRGRVDVEVLSRVATDL